MTKAKRLMDWVYYNGYHLYIDTVEDREEETIERFGEEYTRLKDFLRTIDIISRSLGTVSIRTLNDMQKELEKIIRREDNCHSILCRYRELTDKDLKSLKRWAMAINFTQRTIDFERTRILEARAMDKGEKANGTGYGMNEYWYKKYGRMFND